MMYLEKKSHKRKIGVVGKSSLSVVIPYPIVFLLKLKKGDEVEIHLVDGKIVMEKK